eukprot:TRINITY_DN8944_c0_g1_i1.p1 TRINITY_DN8944_c0_g1~~TRINITY_DN8944_c0_g1_i1.p1  ORF type:complete len:551 (+),score=8.18 TRINITY_DN8944_c0_g1_i1:100-1752(+)
MLSTKRSASFELNASIWQALPTHIDSQLLRAVPMTTVLEGCGRHWKSIAATAEAWNLSEEVCEIDDFLSHDWGTSRAQKFVTLCCLYNERAACIVSCCSAIPVHAVGSMHAWASIFVRPTAICPVIYFGVLFFGQRLMACLMSRKYISYGFLDKLCICQTDEVKKAAGIKGLGAFLRASKRLVILWSPRYFSRLWCTYELVAWCYLHGLDPSRVRFCPPASYMLRVLSMVAFSAYLSVRSFYLTIIALNFETTSFAGTYGLAILWGGLVFILLFHIAAWVQDLCLVQSHVQSFSIRASQCFCCSNDHTVPLTGEEIACDRKLVYATLAAWHDELQRHDADNGMELRADTTSGRDSKIGLEEALDCFDEVVRNDLSVILSRVSNSSLIYCDYKHCLSSIGVVYVWFGVETAAFYWGNGDYFVGIRWLVELSTVPLFVFPLACAGLVRTAAFMGASRCVSLSPRCMKVSSSTLAAFAWYLIFYGLWSSGPMLVDDREVLTLWDILLVLRWLGLAAVTLCVLRSPRGSLEPADQHTLAEDRRQFSGDLTTEGI